MLQRAFSLEVSNELTLQWTLNLAR